MDEAEEYDVSIMDKMAKYGLLGIPFSKEDGGSGASVLSYALCVEELAKVDASTATACSVHTSLCTTLIGRKNISDPSQAVRNTDASVLQSLTQVQTRQDSSQQL